MSLAGARSNIVLLTGTDTGVGKTFVGAALARALRRQELRVVAIKPVESGCSAEISSAEDGCILAAATEQKEPRCALVRLRAPVAPPVAADEEAARLDFDGWVEQLRDHARRCDILLVEGAGGLLSPLTWECSALDLARAVGARTLVVGSDRLGCLNHVLLTLRVLDSEDVPCAGVVLSAPEVPDHTTGKNEAALRRAGALRNVVTLPRAAALDDQVVARLAESAALWVRA